MTADVELLPCPFCGGTNVGEDWVTTYSVDSSYAVFGCRDCGARYEDGGPNEWNRRYTAAKDAEIEALKAEVAAQRTRADAMAGEAIKHEARADRLAEAMRLIESAKSRGFGIYYAQGVAQSTLRHHGQESKDG